MPRYTRPHYGSCRSARVSTANPRLVTVLPAQPCQLRAHRVSYFYGPGQPLPRPLTSSCVPASNHCPLGLQQWFLRASRRDLFYLTPCPKNARIWFTTTWLVWLFSSCNSNTNATYHRLAPPDWFQHWLGWYILPSGPSVCNAFHPDGTFIMVRHETPFPNGKGGFHR